MRVLEGSDMRVPFWGSLAAGDTTVSLEKLTGHQRNPSNKARMPSSMARLFGGGEQWLVGRISQFWPLNHEYCTISILSDW